MPDRLRVEETIGSGAIARVVRVVDAQTGRAYAAKILHERHQRDSGASRRFAREAELSRALQHENLVRVFDVVALKGQPALVMELVEGPTLAEHIAKSGALAQDELLRLAHGLAAGLAHAHAAGVIHRDLKPANVLLAPGSTPGSLVPKIADFGMARASSFASADKGALTVLGTPQYMAPECLDPLAVDPRADLYALGCMLFEMATGRPPFEGATPFSVLDQHRNTPAPPVPETYGEALRELVAQLLAKSAGDRPQSAQAIAERISALDPAGDTTALVAANPAAMQRADGDCASCGAAVVREARVCFRCGLVQPRYEPGSWSVFVVGPGAVSDKLGTEPRDRLLRWFRANEGLGIVPTKLAQRIPRLPFVLVSGVSQACAEALGVSLEHLGLQADWKKGGRLSHLGIESNAQRLAKRALAVCLAICGTPVMVSPMLLAGTAPLFVVCVPVVYGTLLARVSAPMAQAAKVESADLPAAVHERLAALPEVIASVRAPRYRDALRAVVHRVITLCRDVPSTEQAEIGAEMDHALGVAIVAVLRMDDLDRQIAAPQFDSADPSSRAVMHERDRWSARLLGLTATLEALGARQAAALAPRGSRDHLDDLRAAVDALEEVERG